MQNIFPKLQQQQLRHCSHFSKSLYLQEVKQHERSTSNEERTRELDIVIPQDDKRTGGNNRCAGTSKGDDEDSQEGQHDNHGDGK